MAVDALSLEVDSKWQDNYRKVGLLWKRNCFHNYWRF